jgi:hypothetical protein
VNLDGLLNIISGDAQRMPVKDRILAELGKLDPIGYKDLKAIIGKNHIENDDDDEYRDWYEALAELITSRRVFIINRTNQLTMDSSLSEEFSAEEQLEDEDCDICLEAKSKGSRILYCGKCGSHLNLRGGKR